MVNHGQYWIFNYGTWGFDMTFNDIQCGKIISQPFEGHYCWVYHVKMVQVCFRLVTGDLYASKMRIRPVGFLRIHYTFKMLGVYQFRGIEPFKMGHPVFFSHGWTDPTWGFNQLRWRILTFKTGCPCRGRWVACFFCGTLSGEKNMWNQGCLGFPVWHQDWRIFVSSLEMLAGWDFGAIGRFGILSYGQWMTVTHADQTLHCLHPYILQALGGQTSHMSFGPDTEAYAFSGYQRVPRGELLWTLSDCELG